MKTLITTVLMFATSVILMASPQGNRPGRGIGSLDTNGDGQITQTEFEAAHLARFENLDTNGDGILTQDEFPQPRQRGNRAGLRGFRLLMIADTDQDRTITSEELDAFLAQVVGDDGETIDHEKVAALVGTLSPRRTPASPPTVSEVRAKFEQLDSNGDGAVDASEIPRRGPRRGHRGMAGMVILKAADTDGTIGVTADEWAVFLNSVVIDDAGNVDLEALLATVHANRRGGPVGDGPHPLARVLDSDDDGTLTLADLQAGFDTLDTNGDGSITEDELPRRRSGRRGR